MKICRNLVWVILFVFSGTTLASTNKKTIHLIASSTQYDEQVVPEIIQMFNKKGYDVNTSYLDQQVSDLGYVNTDKNRAETLTAALKDNDVTYLWFIRGGGGAFNLIRHLYNNKDEIKDAKPKIIIGFSDVTAVNYFINKYIGWPSMHAVVAAHNKDMYVEHRLNKTSMNNSVDEVFNAIKNGVHYDGVIPLNKQAEQGVSGILTGGNLTLIQSFFSTEYEKYLPDEILAIEDVGVTYRQLDRTLHQLEYKKDFYPKAIIFGQFFSSLATEQEKLIFKFAIEEFAQRYPAPVFYYPYFGHGETNNPLLLSSPVTIKCEGVGEYCQLTQPMMKLM